MNIQTVEEKRTVTNYVDGDFKLKLSDMMGLCARLFVGAIIVLHDKDTYNYCTKKNLVETIGGIEGQWECKQGEKLRFFFMNLVSACAPLDIQDTKIS